VPVELFDPFRTADTSGLPAEDAAKLEEYKLEAVVALGLATMASDPAAYSIEILPEKVKRRREFAGGTVWAIAAAVLAAGFLGLQYAQASGELSKLRSEVATLDGKLRRAKEADRRTREVSAENAALAVAAGELHGLAGSGEQLARVLEQLESDLPDGFWIEGLSTDFRVHEGLRVARGSEKPVIKVAGRAREGTESIAALLDTYVGKLRARFPAAEIVYAPSPSGEKFTLDLTLHAPARASGNESEAAK
jgi:hypothetical protein